MGLTEKEIIKKIIKKIKQFKKIKPNAEWVSLVKTTILSANYVSENDLNFQKNSARKISYQQHENYKVNFSRFLQQNFQNLIFQKKFAFVSSVVLLVFIGLFGVAQHTLPGDVLFSVKEITENSQATLKGSSEVKTGVEKLKKRSYDLAQAKKENKNNNISPAINEVKKAVNILTEVIIHKPEKAKEVALEIKNDSTLLNIVANSTERELIESYNSLYKSIADQMIMDLLNVQLTSDQQKELDQASLLFFQGEYVKAVEKLLMIQ